MTDSIETYIHEAKSFLRKQGNTKKSFLEVSDFMGAEVEKIRELHATGKPVIPEIGFADIMDGTISKASVADIRHRACVIVRGVFDRSQAEDWNAEIGEYLTENNYIERAKEKAGLDNYFGDLSSGAPQIYGVYWSRPQVMARQSERLAATKRFLNRLWDVSGPAGDEFDPDFDYAYADRTRRREPGDTSLGLSPHMDSGSFERWLDPAFQKIYAPIFAGNWQDYDPWRARHRTQSREYASPAVCSMFRTFQGWTALTEQGPDDGTLSLLPLAGSISYFLLRALQDDVADTDLCGALPGRALGAHDEWHSQILGGMVSIPVVEPGDTVWWHPDVVHSVADKHAGSEYANVIYIGASPKCPKNEAYARKQAATFLSGRSAPDFAPEDFEVNFKGRAMREDLSDLGRQQMCIE